MVVWDEPTAGETADPQGAPVVLLLRVWQEKILNAHPEIDSHMADVLKAVESPDHVAPRPRVRESPALLR